MTLPADRLNEDSVQAPAPEWEWGNLQTGGHSVQLYDDDGLLLDGLTRFAGAALGAGDPVVIIATGEHRNGLVERLTRNGLDVATAVTSGRYVALDAGET